MRLLATFVPFAFLVACEQSEEVQRHISAVEAGEETYRVACAECHGENGTGDDENPSLWVEVPMHPDDQLAMIIRAGRGDMDDPGVAQEDIADLVVYLRHRFGEWDGSAPYWVENKYDDEWADE